MFKKTYLFLALSILGILTLSFGSFEEYTLFNEKLMPSLGIISSILFLKVLGESR